MTNPRFERNLGFLSSGEQARLSDSSISIAGVGGDGGMMAVQLARMGVGALRLADPDTFEIENINRQAVCLDGTLGTNKAKSIGRYVQQINPDINVQVFDEGIDIDNTHDFVVGSDLLIDETEYTKQHLAVMLAREARRARIPNMTALNIAFAAVVTTYAHDGVTLENRLGFDEDTEIEEIEKSTADLSRWLPYLPKYGDLDVLKKVASEEKSAPSIAPGVAIAAGLGATQAVLNLTDKHNKRPGAVIAPKALVFDAMTGKSRIIKYNRFNHYKHLGVMATRSILGRNPTTSY